ncbi:ComEC/Rec2 family competence protein [Flavihumibacter petaseus]|uniref:Uncharacterized protein n=1 Tax=Flavihumibacter petaseus NBRC 106054 TaxID=1220578 RepID=A0A0E9MVP5_9BACT|nr:ComEC/Rec2 family competence protein [Flavihumibacter petaseus]GAO41827.1 hypothetical protein FPE01S_01_08420 [Flavihumibacter petaseus NBRC 106054]
MALKKAPYWQAAPFLRLLPALLVGIVAGDGITRPWLPVTGLSVTSVCLAFFQGNPALCRYHYRWLPGLPVLLLVFSLGALGSYAAQIRHRPWWLGNQLHQVVALVGTPQTIPLPGRRGFSQKFSITEALLTQNRTIAVAGSIQVSLDSNNTHLPMPGETWLLSATPVRKIITRPGEKFNYAAFAARHQLFHQGFWKEQELRKLNSPGTLSAARWLSAAQLSAISAMRKTMPETEAGLAMALLIGYRQEISKLLLQAYSDTGVMHVIAVSGMHLSLLFTVLQHLLKFPEHYRYQQWGKAMLITSIVIFFCGVAGNTPSILRAAVMFILQLLSKLIRKPVNTGQALSLTAFGLLCCEPMWLWDAGFQLSFAALTGIVIYQPLFSQLLVFRNRFLKGVWELAAVTLAAQVLTAPISIKLFHQLPVYFLAANLVAVPLSSVALLTGLLQWLLSAVNLPVHLPGFLTGWLIRIMNGSIGHLHLLPGAVITGLALSDKALYTCYLFLFFVTRWLQCRTAGWLTATLCLALIAGLAYYWQAFSHQ